MCDGLCVPGRYDGVAHVLGDCTPGTDGCGGHRNGNGHPYRGPALSHAHPAACDCHHHCRAVANPPANASRRAATTADRNFRAH